jgi:glycosyltransferase involved in cell wall biosynthesis
VVGGSRFEVRGSWFEVRGPASAVHERRTANAERREDVKIIGLVPVRNEAWILPHTLACLTGFCDVVIVSDQDSDDDSKEICRRFTNVVVLESRVRGVCEQARWELLDAARGYEGRNLWWWNDADELASPSLARTFFERHDGAIEPGTAIECPFYHLWGRVDRYRDDSSPYRPQWKQLAIVDDRRIDYDRSIGLPLHQPRVTVGDGGTCIRAEAVPVFHLQWLIKNRNQIKQAWYRCREWMEGAKTAAAINHRYSITLPEPAVRTTQVPPEWAAQITFPDIAAVDRECSWQERDIFQWFDERTPEFFEPLEIWHIPRLREAFQQRSGRRPRPDRSYRPSWPARARHFGRRVAAAARRRMPV